MEQAEAAARVAEAARDEYDAATAELERASRMKGQPGQREAFVRAWFRRELAASRAAEAAQEARSAANEARRLLRLLEETK